MIQLSEKLKAYLPSGRPYTEIEAALDLILLCQKRQKLTDRYIENHWMWGLNGSTTKLVAHLLALHSLERHDDGCLCVVSADTYITKKNRLLSGERLRMFNLFWDAFAYAHGKAAAADAWLNIPAITKRLFNEILKAAEAEARIRPRMVALKKTPKMAEGWISGRRWEDAVDCEEEHVSSLRPETP